MVVIAIIEYNQCCLPAVSHIRAAVLARYVVGFYAGFHADFHAMFYASFHASCDYAGLRTDIPACDFSISLVTCHKRLCRAAIHASNPECSTTTHTHNPECRPIEGDDSSPV